MIQRIQSVFLGFCVLIFIASVFLPLKYVLIDGNETSINALSAFNNQFSYTGTFSAVSGFIFIGILASIAALFSFKQRYLQIRLCYILIFISLVCFGLLLFTSSVEHYGTLQSQSKLALTLFVVVVVFAFIASVFIKKDINLLKNANRIR